MTMKQQDLSDFFANFHTENYVYEYLYPYPLADLYRRYRVSRDLVDQLGYLLALGEVSLKLLSALAVAQAKWNSNTRDQIKRLRLLKPAFGTWQQLLRTLVDAVDDSTTLPIQENLARCVKDESGKTSTYLKAIEILIQNRNEYVHGSTMTSSVAAAILERIQDPFHQAFQALGFLARTPLILCEDVRRLRRPPCYEATIRICQGCNPVFPYELWRLEEPIDPYVPYLLDPSLSTAYSLHPLVITLENELLGLPNYYFFSHRTGQTYWQTYAYRKENIQPVTGLLEEEIDEFLNGEVKPRSFTLEFHTGFTPAWPVSLESDQKLPSGYKMVGRIGEGRYGVVYSILHQGLDEVRAYKALKPEAARDPRIRKRFEVEARALAKLRNKGVAIDLFEYGETDEGLPYLIMEFAEDGSLEEEMERWGPKSWKEVLDIGLNCFKGLEVIHRLGVLHRDIKLSNILRIDETFRFCDFGVGRFIDSEQRLTIEGDAIGTLAYMAPELREGLSDVRSDIYSLGVSLVYLLAGMPVQEPRTWLYKEYDGDLNLRNALLGMVESVPENRPHSAAAVFERLSTIQRELREAQHEDQESSKENKETGIAAIIQDGLQPVSRVTSVNARIWRSPDGTIYREIPAGEFLMGGTKYPDERPVHRVRFPKPFFIATTMVTNSQFSEFCAKTRYRGDHRNFLLHLRREPFSKQWKHSHAPVVFVSWQDAREYILWRCEQDDRDYRLPTEAQWEYACRAGTRTVYWWGNIISPGQLNAGKKHGAPTPVGAYSPNPWGLFDMLGNAWEWCEDVFDVLPNEESIFYRYCSELPNGTCIDPVNTTPEPLISQRVKPNLRAGRGGSWYSEPHNCRPANRRGEAEESCVRSFGFRLVAHNILEDELEELEEQQM